MKHVAVIVVVALGIVSATVVAEDKPRAFVPPGEEAEQPDISPKDLVSIQFTETPLIEVVNYFITNNNVNIACNASDMKQRVSATVTNVRWQVALETVLKPFELSLVEVEPGCGVYFIRHYPDHPKSRYLSFEVVVEAKPETYYEIFSNPYHNELPQLVTSGRIGKAGVASHRLSAVDAWSTKIVVIAHRYKVWEKRVRLLAGGDPEQTFRAILQEEEKN